MAGSLWTGCTEAVMPRLPRRRASSGVAISRCSMRWRAVGLLVLARVVEVDGLLEMKVDETWFGGERVYKK